MYLALASTATNSILAEALSAQRRHLKFQFVDLPDKGRELLLLVHRRYDHVQSRQNLEVDILLSSLRRLSLKYPLKKAKPIMQEYIRNSIARDETDNAIREARVKGENRCLGNICCNRYAQCPLIPHPTLTKAKLCISIAVLSKIKPGICDVACLHKWIGPVGPAPQFRCIPWPMLRFTSFK
jgi:hypothetical protein